jgi:acyl-CoA thioesterase-1
MKKNMMMDTETKKKSLFLWIPTGRMTALIFSITLTACGGSGGDGSTVITPPPVSDRFANSLVSCGDYKNTLGASLPWKVSRPSDWVVMGSSSAWGAGSSSPAKSWVGLLKSADIASGATVHNIAMGGHSTYNALSSQCVVSANRPKFSAEHNIEKALGLQPDLVLLSYPTNDAAGSLPVLETASNLMLIRWQLAQKNVAVLVLSSQPRNMEKDKQALLLELDKLLKPVVGACFVELHALLADAQGNLDARYDSGDGVHLNDAGHAVIYQAVLARLQSRQCVDIL